MIIRIFSILIFVFLTSHGQSLLENMQDKFDSIQSLQSDFLQEVKIAGHSNSSSIVGTFFYKKKNSYRIELSNRHIISDGVSVWNYDKGNNKVIITPVEDDPLSFSLYRYIMEYPGYCSVASESEGELKLVPDSDELELEYIRIWCDKNYLINKVEIQDYSQNTYTFTLSTIDIEKSISASIFSFTPPEGIKVIDLR